MSAIKFCAYALFVNFCFGMISFDAVDVLYPKAYFVTNATMKYDHDEGPRVLLPNGLIVEGRRGKTESGIKFYSYRGIPYAKPPVGNLRFRSPVPLSGKYSNQILYAKKDRNLCVQVGNNNMEGVKDIKGKEDCLFLNIYVPKTARKKLLPVMVWFYGGAFLLGGSSYEEFAPDYFLESRNVVMITFNYRTGIFGWLSTNDDVCPGNYGLKDQILVLRWIKANIKYFGGNPNKVTIFGGSAGAATISYLLQIPSTLGLFNRVILESGTSLCAWALSTKATTLARITGSLLKANLKSSQTLINHLRKIDYKSLHMASLSSQAIVFPNTLLRGLPFGPTIEADHEDAAITTSSFEMFKNGYIHQVPIIIGYNSGEELYFLKYLQTFRPMLLKYDFQPNKLIPVDMNVGGYVNESRVISRIRKRFFGNKSILLSGNKFLNFVAEDQFLRPIYKTVQFLSQYTNVYFYSFSYKGVLGGGEMNYKGVGHSEEVRYLWKGHDHTGLPVSQQDYQIVLKMIRLWTNFAKTGNPTPKRDNLLENVKWRNVDNDIVCLDIGKTFSILLNPLTKMMSFWDELYYRYGSPFYDTY